MTTKQSKKINFWQIISWVLIGSGLAILVLIFYAPLTQEIKYSSQSVIRNPQSAIEGDKIIPINTDFGIVIPKIGANAKIFSNVNPFDEKEFLAVLKNGVAHAKGTSFPGNGKNIYLFAHSTDAFYNAGRYNAVFYLIGKLDTGDEIDIYYKEQLFKYYVYEKKVVSPSDIKYLQETEEEILTLQTCYPPGTTLKRLIVRAKPSE